MNSKLRFYLRGLGIGILVTAVILIAVKLSNNNGEMTDAEIKRRAAQLGMVEANTYSLIDATTLHTEGEEETPSQDDTSSPVEIDPNKAGEISEQDTEKDSNGSGSFIGDTTEADKTDMDKTDADSTEENGDKADTDAVEENGDKADADTAEDAGNKADADTAEDTGNKADTDASEGSGDKTGTDASEETGNKTDTDTSVGTGNKADTDTSEETGNKADTDTSEETGNKADTETSEENGDKTDTDTTENNGNKTDTDKTEDAGTTLEEGTAVTITIARGSASETAAAILKNAGLITDAVDFNNYMIKNGYDRRIHPGTFEIKAGSTYEEICKIIAG